MASKNNNNNVATTEANSAHECLKGFYEQTRTDLNGNKVFMRIVPSGSEINKSDRQPHRQQI